ncbi:hypothetical protein A1O3_04019 [Capronia epimyces CBS 606.96]|uniref:DUF2406 domain-containing protein n=1 Tax=Capronia epimyces CBS 606.96 TaxID=1182542 RepID=W9YCT2_9EURO|nr:uncharacterized protein A1O3_04019 [Capronia epimyces CBS 606.96]EXJ87061.1 hypothetical protein A1O3_04019 [Capronia epimyces CBS 606.96]
MTTTSPPTSPQPYPDARARAPTIMSLSSQRSRRSSTSTNKLELAETAKDKRRLNTKADPSKALNEATPAEQAQEESTVEDLRRMVHKDHEGNLITDPDRSNPTRHRLERPLDTIRAFNAAAEGTSTRRSSFNTRPSSQAGWNGEANRRASYYSNGGYSPQRPRPSPGGGYYRNSSYGVGPQTSLEETPGSAHMYGRNMRQHSNGHQTGYPSGDSPISAHSYQQSYETMTSGSDEYSKSTNPSSQNSSFDQLHQLRKPEEYMADNPYANDIRFNGVSPHKPLSPYGMGNGHPGQDTASPPPMQPIEYAPNNPRQPIKLNGSPSDPNSSAPAPPTMTTTSKKHSWIKRRFSRRDS